VRVLFESLEDKKEKKKINHEELLIGLEIMP